MMPNVGIMFGRSVVHAKTKHHIIPVFTRLGLCLGIVLLVCDCAEQIML
jgi:hypothetical protein